MLCLGGDQGFESREGNVGGVGFSPSSPQPLWGAGEKRGKRSLPVIAAGSMCKGREG